MKKKGTLSVSIATDKNFQRHCHELDIQFTCIHEGMDTNRYEVEYDYICDIYALGQSVGVNSMSDAMSPRPFTEDELSQK